MSQPTRRLRTPEERVGMLPNASLPPPQMQAATVSENDLLLRALRDRDEQSFGRVLDLYFPGMLRLALSHVRSRATAEEVIQETWLAALQGIHGFEGRSSVRTWLFRILCNIARARGRRDARMRPLSELQPVARDAPTAGALDIIVATPTNNAGHHTALWAKGTDPEHELLNRELGDQIEAAIAVLPARQREVLVLRDVEAWSAADVCNTLGISDTNQRVILHRARERIRKELREYLADTDSCRDADDNDLH
jgi:RNA polymerase sigma-70 factor (ECF subfamily)